MDLNKYLKQDHPDLYGLPTQQALQQALQRVKERTSTRKTLTLKSKEPAPRQQSCKRNGNHQLKGVGHRWRLKRS